jgi:hypothetical protein
MSIFDSTSGLNPVPWLLEKTLRALQDTARLVDLANEPDTTAWYAKTLKSHAGGIIGRLAPVVAFLYEAGQEAAGHDEWGPIVERGSFALAAWCKKWNIADPVAKGFALLAAEKDPDDEAGKAERTEPEPMSAEDERALHLRLEVYASTARRLMYEELSEPAKRLMLWLLFELGHAEHADIAVVSKRFLPGDINATPEEALDVYRQLYERRFVERVEGLADVGPDALALRIVLPGMNDSKHALPYRDETLGFPGARVGGKHTIGNMLHVRLPKALGAGLARWRSSKERLDDLRDQLQAAVGEDVAYVEEVELRKLGDEPRVLVRVRYPMETEDRAILALLEPAVESWAREKVVSG